MTDGSGAVNLGSAYGEFNVSTSGVERQLNQAFGNIERQAEGFFNRVGGGIQRVGDGMASWGSSITAMMAPVAAGLALGVRTFASYEDVLAEIRARTGATADEMERVDAVALQMGADTAFSSTQAAEAILQLLSSGYDLNQAFAALPGVLNAAAASGMELGYTADVVTDALAMWGLGADQANRVSDALARGASASSAEISDLALGLGNVGPIANQFGLSIEDTIAILAAFSERGIKGAEAGTQLRSMLTNMTNDTPKVNAMWRELGISMFDATGQVRPLSDVMGELRERMATMTEEEKIDTIRTLAGAYGQQGLAILTANDAMGDMSTLMGQQTDAATVAAARLDTLNGRTEAFRGSLETLMITALRPFIEQHLKPGIEQMTEFVNRLTAWTTANPELTMQIVRILSVLIALGPTLFAAGKTISFVGRMISGISTIISIAGSVIGFALSPVGLILIGIAAAAGGLYVAWRKNFLGIQAVTAPLFNMLSAIASIVKDDIGGIVSSLMGGDMSGAAAGAQGMVGSIGTAIQAQGPEVLAQMQAFGQRLLDWITTMGPQIADQVVDWIEAFVSWYAPLYPKIVEKGLEIQMKLLDWILETGPKIREKVFEWAGAFIEWIGPMIPPMLAALGDALGQLFGFIAAVAPRILGEVVAWGRAFIDWIAPMIPPFIAALGDLLNRFLGWIIEVAPPILAQLAEWAGQFIAWIAPMIGDLLLELPGIIAAILVWVLGVLPDLIAQLLTWAAAFIDWIGPMIPPMLEALGGVVASVITWMLEEFIPAILAEVPGIVDAFLGFVSEMITEVGPALAEFQTSISDFVINDLVPGVLEYGRQIAQALIDGISNGITELGSQATEAARNLADDVKNEVKDFLGIDSPSTVFAGFGENISQGLANGLNNTSQVMAKMQAMIQVVMSHGQQMAAPMFGMGANIVQGLINGVQSQSAALYATLSAMAMNVRNIMTSAFKIHSPSAVFEGYGENMIAGLANGLNAVAPVEAALGTLSNQTMASAPGAGGAAAGGPMIMIDRIEVQITPDTMQKYPNAQEYANTVADTLPAQLRTKLRSVGGGTVS